MATSEKIEIYRQRYETYRYLDRLFWQMLQIAVGAGSLILVAFVRSDCGPSRWILIVLGLLFTICGFIMLRIRYGLSMNSRVLSKAAAALGDVDIPLTSKWWKNISSLIAYSLILLGVVCFAVARYFTE